MPKLREQQNSAGYSETCRLSSLAGLESLTKLQTLSLYTEGLESLAGLENLTELRELRLYGS